MCWWPGSSANCGSKPWILPLCWAGSSSSAADHGGAQMMTRGSSHERPRLPSLAATQLGAYAPNCGFAVVRCRPQARGPVARSLR
jgi:hypothetical protein